MDVYNIRQMTVRINSQQASCREVLQFYLDRIKKINPYINALFHVDEENLLKQAEKKDNKKLSYSSHKPLHGIPISIKDNIATKDLPTTAGVKTFLQNKSSKDATVVSRLKKAGAIILGKSNTPDLTMSWDTNSTAYGQTRNPHHLEHNPGGSTGGEAAAIASGCSVAGIGNDFGGSLRLPAHYCGVVGYRPTHGLIPTTGIVPPFDGSGFSFALSGLVTVMGPIGRCVEDVELLASIMSGSDDIDPYCQHMMSSLNQELSFKKLRIAYYLDDDQHSADASTTKLFANVVEYLEKFCQKINCAKPSVIGQAWEIFFDLFSCEGGSSLSNFLEENSISEPANHLKFLLERFKNKEKTIQAFLETWVKLDSFKSSMLHFIKDFDLILTFVMPHPAPLISDVMLAPTSDIARVNNLVAYSLMGWPTVVVPIGFSETGLPIGIQIISKKNTDRFLLNFAKKIEKEFYQWKPVIPAVKMEIKQNE
jgi:amidase